MLTRHNPQPIRTVAELRAYLDAVEAEWSAEDEQIQGPFANLGISVPYFTNDREFIGYGAPEVAMGPLVDLTFETPRADRQR